MKTCVVFALTALFMADAACGAEAFDIAVYSGVSCGFAAAVAAAREGANLLVPGAASYTHVAFCTYRLESVWMIAGHAAGVAAAMAAKAGQPVQAVDVPALQARLRAQKQVIDFLPGQPEKFGGGAGGYKEF